MNRIGNMYFHEAGGVFEVMSRDRREVETINSYISKDYEQTRMTFGDFQVIPWGDKDNLPEIVRDTVNNHALSKRIMRKRKLLMLGMGPALYQLDIAEDGKSIHRKWVKDPEVEDWLKSWGYIPYLHRVIEDVNYMDTHFTKMIFTRGRRIGAGKVGKLEYVQLKRCRLAGKELRQTTPPTHVGVSGWAGYWEREAKFYPLFNPLEPYNNGVSIFFCSDGSFGREYYPTPDVVGSLPWMRRATDSPFILEALTKNSIHIKWHIQSPAKFWEYKEERLKEICTQEGKVYQPKMLEELKDQIFDTIIKVLGDVGNVGKFWASETITELMGNTAYTHEWKITPIDQKIKDFVEAQIRISERADVVSVAGLGLHQALSNVAASGKSDSGSEQFYAYKNYMLSETHLPEYLATLAINEAIRINWPEKDIRLGFYRPLPEQEQDVTASKRIGNAVE